jgi:hypothetical protein
MLHRLRRDVAFESDLAEQAGVTTALYRAIELGHVPCTRAVYDVVSLRFPQLKVFPRPGPDPGVLVATRHSAVTHEYARLQPLMDQCRRLNIGTTNRNIIREMMLRALAGDYTPEDIQFFFG